NRLKAAPIPRAVQRLVAPWAPNASMVRRPIGVAKNLSMLSSDDCIILRITSRNTSSHHSLPHVDHGIQRYMNCGVPPRTIDSKSKLTNPVMLGLAPNTRE